MTSSPDLPGSLVVAVLTYQRPDDLPPLLPELARQAATHGPDAAVLVVDNDPAGSAREVVESLGLPQVRYVVEPEPGIAAARNRALVESLDHGLLIFIDDDERPDPDWVELLVECYRTHDRPVGVAGAVVPDVGAIEDPWITAGEFFVRPRHRTGTLQEAASTANLLLDLQQVRAMGVRFDEAFGLSGGSDTMFTRELVARGGRIVWCDEARVVDHIRVQRLTRAWVLQRHFRSGNSWARTSLAMTGGGTRALPTRLRLTAQGAPRIVLGALRTAYGVLTGSLRHRARGQRTIARGRGMTVGAWGSVYVEYSRDEAGATAGG